MKPIIEVSNLSKRYIIGENIHRGGAPTFRDIFDHKVKNLFTKQNKSKLVKKDNILWALKDINFEVHEGDVLGIIGRNGAGKSTLLKVLSRITEPTTGQVTLRGKIASLLEVGTGFNPELTGRENIFLNGSILGMPKAEIKRKFDEIVSFAEVERFVDTPVKRYSSGMYVRLAFAVAAHLEPEVLIVDEVLAVGDLKFQKKCLGKMSDVSKDGRTVLFVSHNMGAIANLCTRGLLLEKGNIVIDNSVKDVLARYLSVHAGSGEIDLSQINDRSGNGHTRFVHATTRNQTLDICDTFTIGDDIVFDIKIYSTRFIRSGKMSLQIVSIEGISIYHLVAIDAGFELTDIDGEGMIRIVLKNQKIYPGEYFVNLWLADTSYEAFDRINNAFKFYIVEGGSIIIRQLDKASAVVHEIPEWSRIL